ncbi:MAG TPA: cupredoxin domain-containing protein [Mycobacteriales bacterium]
MRALLRIGVAAFALLIAAACSSSGSGSSSNSSSPSASSKASASSSPSKSAATSSATITIKNFKFGAPLTVKPGTKVKVVNNDSAPHNVTSTTGAFKSATITSSQTSSFTAPTKPGKYPFTCTVHPFMHGSLTVSG